MIPVLVKSVWLRNICFSKVATTLFKFIGNYGRRSFSKYGIDIQIVRPEMTKFKMFREKDFYFVGITF